MCNPTTMFAAQAAMAVAGAVAQGVAANAEAKTSAKIAKVNASNALASAAADEDLQRRNAAKIIGQSRVDYGKSGVGFSGTSLDMLAQETAEAELDALKVRAGGQAAATSYRNEAAGAKASGRAGVVSSVFSGGKGLLDGSTSWMDYQQKQKLLKEDVDG